MERKKALTYPVIAGASLLLLTQCGSGEQITEEQQEVANTVEQFHLDLREVQTDVDEEIVADIMENEQDSEYYPDLEEDFREVADLHFITEDLNDEEMFDLIITLAILNESLLWTEGEELPVSVPAEYVEMDDDSATAYLVLSEDELAEEDYEQSDDFDDYEEYVEYSVEHEESDVVELTHDGDRWMILFY